MKQLHKLWFPGILIFFIAGATSGCSWFRVQQSGYSEVEIYDMGRANGYYYDQADELPIIEQEAGTIEDTQDALMDSVDESAADTAALKPYVSTVDGSELFEDLRVAEEIQSYTMDLFSNAYLPYYDIIGFDFDYQTLESQNGQGCIVTFELSMYYRNQGADETVQAASLESANIEETAEYTPVQEHLIETKTATYSLRLETLDGLDQDLYTLFFLANNTTSNKGLPFVPIQEILPPAPSEGIIAIPIGTDELYVNVIDVELDQSAITIEVINDVDTFASNNVDLDIIEEVDIEDVPVKEKEITQYPVAKDVQIVYLAEGYGARQTDWNSFGAYLEEQSEEEIRTFKIYVKNDVVIAITEEQHWEEEDDIP